VPDGVIQENINLRDAFLDSWEQANYLKSIIGDYQHDIEYACNVLASLDWIGIPTIHET
jgi:hypothetical protein